MVAFILCAFATAEAHVGIDHMATVSGVDLVTVRALAHRESQCSELARNRVTGAVGLFQVMPKSAANVLLGWRAAGRGRRISDAALHDPMLNAQVAGIILRRALQRCRGNLDHALSVYNGSGKCESTGFSTEVLALARDAGAS
jgi:soluble lytic murein transglycosylase-like protein